MEFWSKLSTIHNLIWFLSLVEIALTGFIIVLLMSDFRQVYGQGINPISFYYTSGKVSQQNSINIDNDNSGL